jgi:hypothetical protein
MKASKLLLERITCEGCVVLTLNSVWVVTVYDVVTGDIFHTYPGRVAETAEPPMPTVVFLPPSFKYWLHAATLIAGQYSATCDVISLVSWNIETVFVSYVSTCFRMWSRVSCKGGLGESYPCNRPWIPIGLWDVEAAIFSRQSAHRWRWSCQPLAPAALVSPRKDLWYSFVSEAESTPEP